MVSSQLLFMHAASHMQCTKFFSEFLDVTCKKRFILPKTNINLSFNYIKQHSTHSTGNENKEN